MTGRASALAQQFELEVNALQANNARLKAELNKILDNAKELGALRRKNEILKIDLKLINKENEEMKDFVRDYLRRMHDELKPHTFTDLVQEFKKANKGKEFCPYALAFPYLEHQSNWFDGPNWECEALRAKKKRLQAEQRLEEDDISEPEQEPKNKQPAADWHGDYLSPFPPSDTPRPAPMTAPPGNISLDMYPTVQEAMQRRASLKKSAAKQRARKDGD